MAWSRRRTSLVVGLLIALACAFVLATRLQVSTAITDFAVDERARDDSRWISILGGSEPARTIVFTVAHANLDDALASAERLATALAKDPEVAWVRLGVDPEVGTALHSVYFPRRFRMISRAPEQDLAARFSDEALDRRAERLRQELGRPTGAAIKRLAPEDPWLLFMDRMDALRSLDAGGLRLQDGRFISADGTAAVVLAATRHPPMDGAVQARLQDVIEAEIAERSTNDGVTIERSSLHRFAVSSERGIRSDIQTLSICSSLGVLALLLSAYRSPRLVALAFIPLGSGVLAATAVTVLLFGQIHGLTLAFGTTLLGVCLDYPVHLLTHHVAGDKKSTWVASLHAVWPGVMLGALTTIVGFAVLGLGAQPGVGQIGVFAAVGTGAALAATRFLVAPWLPIDGSARPGAVAAAQRVWAGLQGLRAHPKAVGTVAAALVGLTLIGLTRLEWVDDATALNALQPAMLAEDARVRGQVTKAEVGQVLIAEETDLDGALAVQDELFAGLDARGMGQTWRSSANLLTSRELQARNLAAVRRVPDLVPRTLAALGRAGFRPEAFGGLEAALHHDPGPVDLSTLEKVGLRTWIDPFMVRTETGVALLSFPTSRLDAPAAAALTELVEQVPGASLFDQGQFFRETYRHQRRGTLPALGLGVLGVFAVLALRYRSVRVAAAVLSPALLAALMTFGILAWLGIQLHLLHLVAILLVLSIGVDYGVFMGQSAESPRQQAATVLSIVIACASTVLSFGLLGLAHNPAMQALGLTTALGVVISAVLAPLVVGWVPRRGAA